MSIVSAFGVKSITVSEIEKMQVSGTNVRSIFIESMDGSMRLHLFSDNENNLVIKEAEDDL